MSGLVFDLCERENVPTFINIMKTKQKSIKDFQCCSTEDGNFLPDINVFSKLIVFVPRHVISTLGKRLVRCFAKTIQLEVGSLKDL